MNSKAFATRFTLSIAGMLALASLSASPALADDHGSGAHGGPRQNALVKVVREIDGTVQNVAAAEGAGYALAFGCVSGPDAGAMGLHYVNMPLVLDGEIDATRPRSSSTSRLATGRCA